MQDLKNVFLAIVRPKLVFRQIKEKPTFRTALILLFIISIFVSFISQKVGAAGIIFSIIRYFFNLMLLTILIHFAAVMAKKKKPFVFALSLSAYVTNAFALTVQVFVALLLTLAMRLSIDLQDGSPIILMILLIVFILILSLWFLFVLTWGYEIIYEVTFTRSLITMFVIIGISYIVFESFNLLAKILRF